MEWLLCRVVSLPAASMWNVIVLFLCLVTCQTLGEILGLPTALLEPSGSMFLVALPCKHCSYCKFVCMEHLHAASLDLLKAACSNKIEPSRKVI